MWSQVVLAKNFAKGGDFWIFGCWHHFRKNKYSSKMFDVMLQHLVRVQYVVFAR
jgi:hypothetical protein